MRALLHAAEAKAQELRCAAIRIHIEGAKGKRPQQFAASGFRQQASVFCKEVSPPGMPG